MMHSQLAPGDKAPSFTLPADGGREISLSDYRGRKVVLFFYPKDDTTGCTREAKEFSALKDQFNASSTSIIGVSADPVASHNRFKTKHDLTVDLASDTEKDLLQSYGVWQQKSMYGRTYMGIERSTVLIDRQGRIARIWRKVKVPGHADEVLQAAKELG